MRPFHKDVNWSSDSGAGSRSGGLRAELSSYNDSRAGKRKHKKPYGAVIWYSGWLERGFSFTNWYPTERARETALRSHGGTLRSFKVVHVEMVER